MLLTLAVSAFCLSAAALAQTTRKVTLPWGTYEGTYDQNGDYYKFSNIRYAKAPTGSRRFNKSELPDPVPNPGSVQGDSGSGFACWGVNTKNTTCESNPGLPGSGFLHNPAGHVTEGEDCLFLDVFASKKALDSTDANIPVVVWFYGGAYLFGAKDQSDQSDQGNSSLPYYPLYSGTGLLRQAALKNQPVIYVVGNYRLGAYGWLGGQSMQNYASQNVAFPNTGLYDQRLILQFVNQYINRWQGNNGAVSVWGESAGAGSILHHLVAKWQDKNKGELLFQKAIVQSPAFQWQVDPSPAGLMERAYQNLTKLTGCAGKGIECLQAVPDEQFVQANQRLFEATACTGVFTIGPSVDGSLIRELPAVSFRNGARANLVSFIDSHVWDESSHFVPRYITATSGWDYFLSWWLPGDNWAWARTAISQKYASEQNQTQRALLAIRDSTFTCNTRQLFDAYGNSATSRYLLQYAFGSTYGVAVHGSDLLPTFWNSDVNVTALLQSKVSCDQICPGWAKELGVCDTYCKDAIKALAFDMIKFAGQYQTYLLSHATRGDPEALFDGDPPIAWPHGTPGDVFSNVMETSLLNWKLKNFELTDDQINTAATCDFWQNLAVKMSSIRTAAEAPSLRVQDRAQLEL